MVTKVTLIKPTTTSMHIVKFVLVIHCTCKDDRRPSAAEVSCEAIFRCENLQYSNYN